MAEGTANSGIAEQVASLKVEYTRPVPTWESIQKPRDEDADWGFTVPSYIWRDYCDAHLPRPRNRWTAMRNGAFGTFLRYKPSDDDLELMRNLENTFRSSVGIKDLTDGSFALDLHIDPQSGLRSQIGELLYQAKYRGDSFAPVLPRISNHLVINPCLQSFDAVIAIPSSNPHDPNSLPLQMARFVATEFHCENLSASITRARSARQLKNLDLTSRIQELTGTLSLTTDTLEANILLVDDLYQSGTSVNMICLLLRRAGAKSVRALTVTKTLSNKDNTTWQSLS